MILRTPSGIYRSFVHKRTARNYVHACMYVYCIRIGYAGMPLITNDTLVTHSSAKVIIINISIIQIYPHKSGIIWCQLYYLCLLCVSFRVVDASKIPQPLLRLQLVAIEKTHSDAKIKLKTNLIVRKRQNAFRFFRLESLQTPCATRKCRQCGFHRIR